MSTSADRLFVVETLPGSPRATLAGLHALAIAGAVLAALALWSGGLAGRAAAACLGAWMVFSVVPDWLVAFERRRLLHCGHVAARRHFGRLWRYALAIAATLGLAGGALPVLAPLGAWGVVLALLLLHARGAGLKRLVRSHHEVLFAFMRYPDRRYRAPAGLSAVWVPRLSNAARCVVAAGLLAPFYLVFLLRAGHLPPALLCLEAPLILPLPAVTLLVILAGPLRELQRASHSGAESEWNEAVQRVASSTMNRDGAGLSEHLFLGWVLPAREQAWHPLHTVDRFDLPGRTPALVHRGVLDGHAHIGGPTQSGKTTIGQVNLITQIIRPHTEPAVDAGGNPLRGLDGRPYWREAEPAPLLILDLKGDLALYNTVREECLKRDQVFRALTLELGKATSYFNPLANLACVRRSPIELCEICLYMLDLFHGFFYGGSYYSEQARHLLLKTLQSARRTPATWEELYQLLLETLDRREHRDAFELVGRIFAIAQYPMLGPAPEGADVVHFPGVFERNECVYLWLPALESAMSVVGVAKMALFCFLDAARKWNHSGRPPKRGYAFLDEAQVICGRVMERVFQQASGSRVSLILSNQSLSNLDTRDAPNLSRTIWTNTAFKLSFGLLDQRECEDWIALSGETSGWLSSYQWGLDGEGNPTFSSGRQQVLRPRLSPNAFSATNNQPGAALLYVKGDRGLAQYGSVPHQIVCPYPMSLAEYRRRSTSPWPSAPETQVQGGAAQTTMVNGQAPAAVEAQAGGDYARLEELFREIARRRPAPRAGAPA